MARGFHIVDSKGLSVWDDLDRASRERGSDGVEAAHSLTYATVPAAALSAVLDAEVFGPFLAVNLDAAKVLVKHIGRHCVVERLP